jgi:hypothetical protein
MGTRPYLYELKRGRKKMQNLQGLSSGMSQEPAGTR